MSHDERLSVSLLGPLWVTVGGQEVVISGARRRDVLIRLLLNEGRPLESGQLLESVWEGDAPAGAANSLQAHIGYLRRQLGGGRLVTSGRAYRLELEQVTVDSVEFEREVTAARIALAEPRPAEAVGLLRSALARWRGPVLVDVVDHSWGQAEIARLTELHGAAQELLLQALLANGQCGDVVVAGERAVAEHPLREELWRSLMLGLARAGRRAEAGRVFRRYRTWLGGELGLEPSVELFALDAAIISGVEAPRSAPAGGWAPAPLPQPASTMVGRDDERRRLSAVVAAPGLITLVGAGGVGKTRMALEVAHAAAARSSDPEGSRDVWFVDLAPVSGSSAVATAVCKALGVLARPDGALEELERAVGGGLRSLIVLDNCEHVLDAAADVVASIMRHSSSVTVLATSRQPLDVDGEQVWPVHPLPIGVAGTGGAIDLFLRRSADAGAVVAADEHASVGAICQRLDGLPLAVELAAARVRALGADGLLASLSERLDGLTGGHRATPRHQTLRAAVEWSLDLLSPRQRLGFALLSVFAGGFDLRAAETVLLVEGFDRGEAADLMVELVDRSMVEPDVIGHTRRYRLLETLRHYGSELLDKHGGDAARHAHSEHYIELAVALAALANGPEQGIALEQYELEIPNVRAVFERSLEADDIQLAGRVAEVGMEFGYYWLDFEAVAWAEAVREPARAQRLPVAVTLIAICAYETYLRGDLTSGLAQIADAEQLAAQLEVPVPPAVRAIKGDLLTMHDPAAAVVVYDEMAAEAREQGAPHVVAFATWAAVLTRHYSSPHDVEADARHAVEVCRAHGQPVAYASSLCVLALVLVERHPGQSRRLLDEAAEIAAPVRDRFTQLRIQLIRARVEIEQVDSPAGPIAALAIGQVFDELARTSDLASRWQFFAMAAFLLAHRPAADVATVVGIFEARHVENNRRQWLDGVGRARAELGDDEFEQLVGQGAALNDHQAVAFLSGRP
ncbi:MAG: BTAD domain-containing putative transcriptional regulator [Ilumatobacteraceae bacterium]